MKQLLSLRSLCRLGCLTVALCHGALLHAQGIQRFPTESGFSGNISVGASYMAVASNFATHKSKLGEDDLESLDSKPDTQEQVLGFPRFELAYTFADAGWQLHLGNAALDFYRFDRANVAGVRKNFGTVGVIGVGYVFSALPDYVWEDPYRLSSEREETRRGSAGGRISWDFIGGSPINLRYTQRNIRVGDEASGSDLGLDFEAQQDLRRDGAQRVAEINMFVPLGGGKVLLPAINYIRNDREGDAVSNQSIQLRVVYKMPLSSRWTMLADVLAGGLTAQEENPIFLDTEKNKRFGAGLTFKYDRLFGVEPMSLVVRAGSYREDSNIDFYSGNISTFGAFIGYKF